MSYEKEPSVTEGSFSCQDLYDRAAYLLLAHSTSRVLTLAQRERLGMMTGVLAEGGNGIIGHLPYVTRQHRWTNKHRDTVRYGGFEIRDQHYMESDDFRPLRHINSPQEQQRELALGIAALHININTRDYLQHYDIFYPEHLKPGERLHTTIMDVDPNELQYKTPADWPEGQPLLLKLYCGDNYDPIPDPSQDANLVRVYTALCNGVSNV